MKKKMSLAALIVLIAMAGFAQAAYHHEGEADSPKFVSVYPAAAGTKLDSCALCHTGGEYEKNPGQWVAVGSCQWCHLTYGYDGSGDIEETMNRYGADYGAAGRSAGALASIDGRDSDGDGYTNRQEINALSYPGDTTDDPTKIPAPSVTYTLSELEALPSHNQFMLMNTSRSGDWYAEYQGVPMLDLLREAGMIEETTKAITVFAPDGYFYTYELNPGGEYYFINGIYPQSQYYYDVQADKANGGWCDYSAPSCTGRNDGDLITVEGGLQFILAYKRDGAYLEPGYLDEENRIPLDREGPFRSVPPQMVPCPPDQSSTSEDQDVGWPFNEDLDHNAGFSARVVVAIRIEPLPEGTSDYNWYEGGWDYVDEKSVIIYGNLASGGIQGQVVDRETTLPIDNVVISTNKGGYAATTDIAGNYTISGMKVGSYTVRAAAAGYQSESQSVAVTKDAEQTVNFSLSAATNPCPIETMLPADFPKIVLLRNYRDQVLMATAEGRAYVKRYYEHAAEILGLLLFNSDIRTMAFAALHEMSSSIEHIIAGRQASLSASQSKIIGLFIEKMKKASSPRLQSTLCLLERDMQNREASRMIFALSQ
jgi:hypothetical protein